jgi:DNA-directed RNA polymerase specialized sigma24 family protein
MAADPAHLSDDLVRVAFSPFLDGRLPPHLGSEAFKTTRKRLGVEGFTDVEHAQEVFARALTNGLTYLNKHGGASIRQPRPWFHGICRNEATRYLTEMAAHDSGSVLSLVDGDTDLLDANIYDPERVDKLLRNAIEQLPPRHRELILLDMVKRLPASEIEKSMGIHSHSYFLKLKSEAFSALKYAVKTLIEKGISSLL